MSLIVYIVKEYGHFYGVEVINSPDFALSEQCKIVGHKMVRDQIAIYRHFDNNDSFTTVDSFLDACETCGIKFSCYRLNDYEKQEIILDNKFTHAVDIALEKRRPTYFEFNLPENEFYRIKNCEVCKYESEYVKIKDGDKLTDDSLIVKNDYKIQYEVGSCVVCDHRYDKIIPFNLKHNKPIRLCDSDFISITSVVKNGVMIEQN